MIALAAEDLADLRRWAISAAVVVTAYGGIAAAMVTWHDIVDGAGMAAGIVIEFAPVAVGPVTLAPGPEQDIDSPDIKEKIEQKLETKPEQKVEERVESKPIEEPPPEVAPAPNPDVAVQPPPPQEVKRETPQPQEPSPARTATAPQVISDQTAAIPAAP